MSYTRLEPSISDEQLAEFARFVADHSNVVPNRAFVASLIQAEQQRRSQERAGTAAETKSLVEAAASLPHAEPHSRFRCLRCTARAALGWADQFPAWVDYAQPPSPEPPAPQAEPWTTDPWAASSVGLMPRSQPPAGAQPAQDVEALAKETASRCAAVVFPANMSASKDAMERIISDALARLSQEAR